MAAGLADGIRKAFGVSPSLREGHDGIFEVRLDGDVIYSNGSECGRLPEPLGIHSALEKGGAKPLGDVAGPADDPSIFRGLSCALPSDSGPGQPEAGKDLSMADGGCVCNSEESENE